MNNLSLAEKLVHLVIIIGLACIIPFPYVAAFAAVVILIRVAS